MKAFLQFSCSIFWNKDNAGPCKCNFYSVKDRNFENYIYSGFFKPTIPILMGCYFCNRVINLICVNVRKSCIGSYRNLTKHKHHEIFIKMEEKFHLKKFSFSKFWPPPDIMSKEKLFSNGLFEREVIKNTPKVSFWHNSWVWYKFLTSW